MKAVQFEEYGGPEVLHVGDRRGAARRRRPDPGGGRGRQREPHRLEDPQRRAGADDAGRVARASPGATWRAWSTRSARASAGVAVGDEVFGFAVEWRRRREHAVLEHARRSPPPMSWAEAAGWPLAVETAVRSLNLLGVTSGRTLLVDGAAGGVGSAALQFARVRGARVIGTASPSNHAYLRTLGAEPTTYGEGLVDRVRELAPDGVDVALDAAGFGALPDLIAATGGPGNVVTIADFSAAEHGVRLTPGPEGRAWEALDQAAELYEAGALTIPVETFGLEQLPEAHRVSEAGHVRGKLVLIVA